MDVLFVCLGNICRSPMAEAVLLHLTRTRADASLWTVDSAGTGAWHVGADPHAGTLAACARHGVPISHVGRQIDSSDFFRFDRILAMDRMNMRDLRGVRPRGATAIMELLGKYDPQGESEVPDPYHSEGPEEFEAVFAQVERCCRAFLATVGERKATEGGAGG